MKDRENIAEEPPKFPEIEPASAEDGLTPPPPPTVKTRIFWPSFLGGNALIILLLFAIARDWVPNWLAILVAIFGLGLLIWAEERNTTILRSSFYEPRLKEIMPYYADANAAIERATSDFKASVNTSQSVDVIAMPMLLATFLAPIWIFVETDHSLAGMFWLLRWAVAAVCAFLSWSVLALACVFANLSAAGTPFDYQSLRKESPKFQSLDPEDQNDIHIIREMSNLESLHKRIDTYTLESALLSALSFSSFLSIALSERNYDAQLRDLFSPKIVDVPIAEPWNLPLAGTIDHVTLPSAGYFSDHIVALIAISLLLCATTFLGVLVARLRFNDGYRDAESALKAAERLNEREDLALERNLPQKVAIYALAIEEMLQKSIELQTGLTFTVMHMRWSRNAGIACFIIALILCGFFFNAWVAGFIGLIFAVAVLFGSIDRQTRARLRERIFEQGLAALLRPLRHKGSRT